MNRNHQNLYDYFNTKMRTAVQHRYAFLFWDLWIHTTNVLNDATYSGARVSRKPCSELYKVWNPPSTLFVEKKIIYVTIKASMAIATPSIRGVVATDDVGTVVASVIVYDSPLMGAGVRLQSSSEWRREGYLHTGQARI